MKSGYGELTRADGSTYKGEWQADLCHGNCTESKDSEGNIYSGSYKNDIKDGQGTLKCVDGSEYYGVFVNGKRNGKGILTFANGTKYQGEFLDGVYHGMGKITPGNEMTNSEDNWSYDGPWDQGMRQGKGVLIDFVTGQRWEGNWQANEKHGLFTTYWPNGDSQEVCIVSYWAVFLF